MKTLDHKNAQQIDRVASAYYVLRREGSNDKEAFDAVIAYYDNLDKELVGAGVQVGRRRYRLYEEAAPLPERENDA